MASHPSTGNSVSPALLIVAIIFSVAVPPLGFGLGLLARSELPRARSGSRIAAMAAIAISSTIMGAVVIAAHLVLVLAVVLVVEVLGGSISIYH